MILLDQADWQSTVVPCLWHDYIKILILIRNIFLNLSTDCVHTILQSQRIPIFLFWVKIKMQSAHTACHPLMCICSFGTRLNLVCSKTLDIYHVDARSSSVWQALWRLKLLWVSTLSSLQLRVLLFLLSHGLDLINITNWQEKVLDIVPRFTSMVVSRLWKICHMNWKM